MFLYSPIMILEEIPMRYPKNKDFKTSNQTINTQ